jgi:thiamine biosynthesis protein ThiI
LVESEKVTGNTRSESNPAEKVVFLISGGIDSPVSAWLLMRKRITPVFVYFDNSPFTDESTQLRALEAVEKLRKLITADDVKLYIVPHGDDLADILRNCPRNLTCVLCRRMMYRVAERIALEEGAEAIATGEIIGEHASQTITNLRIVSQVISKVSIMRPLIGMNKTEVERLARKIGTFDASTKPASCCSGPPPKPRTRAKFEEVQEAERRLDIDGMVKRDLRGASVFKGLTAYSKIVRNV